MAANTAWGVDIGNRALKAVKLVREGDALRIDDFDVIEHDTVLSNAGDNRESLIQAALANFVSRHQIRKTPVAVGVSGQSSFARFIKLPPVEPKKIPEIVRFEAIQQTPFPLDDVEWSYQLFQPTDSPDVEVGIFAMRKELVNQHIQYFTDSDMNVELVQMNPLAVYNGMYYDGKVRDTTMVIDLGAETTDLIIADTETIWLRSIPIGGNNFTEALVKAFKLNFQKAEELKRNAASSKYARQIFQAMRPVFADLVAEVQRSIGFYASVHRESRIKRIVGIGGTFKLPGLQKYLQQNLQLDVERLESLGSGIGADNKQAALFQDNVLSLVSAYGLAAQAVGEGKITSSLLPQHIRRERMWKEKTKWFAAAAALFALGTGVGYGSWFVHNVAYDQVAAARSEVTTVHNQAKALDSTWAEVESAGSVERQRIANVESLTDYRALWAKLMGDIVNAVPQSPAGDAEALKQTPRNLRQMVWVDRITANYLTDVSGATSASTLKQFLGSAGAVSTGYRPPVKGSGVAPVAGESAGPAAAVGGGIDYTNSPYGAAGPYGGMPMGGGPPPEIMAMIQAQTGYNPFGAAGMAPGGEAASTGPKRRGFVFRVTGVTPYTGGSGAPYATTAAFIDNVFVKALAALQDDERLKDKRYTVLRAELLSANQIGEARLAQMRADFDAALAAERGEVTAAVAGTRRTPAGGGPGGASRNPYGAGGSPYGASGSPYGPGGSPYGPGGSGMPMGGGPPPEILEMIRRGGGGNVPPGAFSGMSGRARTGGASGATGATVTVNGQEYTAEQIEELALQDRLTGEPVSNDWEFEVGFAVALDPDAPAAAEGEDAAAE